MYVTGVYNVWEWTTQLEWNVIVMGQGCLRCIQYLRMDNTIWMKCNCDGPRMSQVYPMLPRMHDRPQGKSEKQQSDWSKKYIMLNVILEMMLTMSPEECKDAYKGALKKSGVFNVSKIAW